MVKEKYKCNVMFSAAELEHFIPLDSVHNYIKCENLINFYF